MTDLYTSMESGPVTAAAASEKTIKHYSSLHKILLVGECDFSFSARLATAFGSAANMVATSIESKDSLLGQYSRASKNLELLERLGCTVVHEVDATTMSLHPLLRYKSFDRIVFDFPHAGFILPEYIRGQILLHQILLRGFLKNAKEMVSENGEINITHKTSHPFKPFNFIILAEEAGLSLKGIGSFYLRDYPNYVNKRGAGSNCDGTFHV